MIFVNQRVLSGSFDSKNCKDQYSYSQEQAFSIPKYNILDVPILTNESREHLCGREVAGENVAAIRLDTHALGRGDNLAHRRAEVALVEE